MAATTRSNFQMEASIIPWFCDCRKRYFLAYIYYHLGKNDKMKNSGKNDFFWWFYLKASYSIFCTLAASGSEIYGQFKFQNRGISCSLRKIFLLKFSTLKDF